MLFEYMPFIKVEGILLEIQQLKDEIKYDNRYKGGIRAVLIDKEGDRLACVIEQNVEVLEVGNFYRFESDDNESVIKSFLS